MPLDEINRELIGCRACPRLVEWRERVAVEKRAAFRDQVYWGRPVPGLGAPGARLVVVGLAPAAHGANRTGRMFTGDRSGEWLVASLHRAGFANQPTSTHPGDGLALIDCYITAPVHCAPPANRPTTAELRTCSTTWMAAELAALSRLEVVVALGGIAFTTISTLSGRLGWGEVSPRPRFGHGADVEFPSGPVLLGSYHPSQQNTFTRRLTAPMLDAIFQRARKLLDGSRSG